MRTGYDARSDESQTMSIMRPNGLVERLWAHAARRAPGSGPESYGRVGATTTTPESLRIARAQDRRHGAGRRQEWRGRMIDLST